MYKNIGAENCIQKHWRIPKHWRLVKTRRTPKTRRIPNLTWIVKTWRLVKTWRIPNLRGMVKTLRLVNTWCLVKTQRIQNIRRPQKCWHSRKSRRTCWRIALLFRLGGICNCWLLPGPADGLVLLLADVLNLVHVVSKWRMVLQWPAFMGGLSFCTVPAVPRVRWRRPRRARITPLRLLSRPCVSDLLRSKRPKAATRCNPRWLDNPNSSYARVWPYATFIVFASSSSSG